MTGLRLTTRGRAVLDVLVSTPPPSTGSGSDPVATRSPALTEKQRRRIDL